MTLAETSAIPSWGRKINKFFKLNESKKAVFCSGIGMCKPYGFRSDVRAMWNRRIDS